MKTNTLPKRTLFTLLTLASCSLMAGERIGEVIVSNSAEGPRVEEPITIPLKGLGVPAEQWQSARFLAKRNGVEHPTQIIDTDGDGKRDAILLLSSLDGNASEHYEIWQQSDASDIPVSAKRTQADLSHRIHGEWVEGKTVGNKERGDYEYVGGEWADVSHLKVPVEHSDHSNYIRYEGIGIESDKVGYRIYLDWRNGFDIFGKTAPSMSLKETGLDGFQSYHEMQPWGMDILKVGDAVGIGGYGYWDGEQLIRVSDWNQVTASILENGHLQSSIRLHYDDWQFADDTVDLTAVLSMQAGSRLVRVQLTTSDDVSGISTGLVKHPGTELIKGNLDITGEAWSYLATWGPQSLDGGQLGMAILFQKRDLRELTADAINDVVVLRSSDRSYEYYFLAAWDKEPGGITTQEQFIESLESEVHRLTIPSRTREFNRLSDAKKSFPMTSDSALKWSRALADTQIRIWGDHLVYGQFDNDIRNQARWSYTTGLMCQAYDDLGLASGDDRYLDQAYRIMDSYVQDDGSIATYRPETFNIDQINSGKMVLRLYDRTRLEKFRIAADALRDQLRDHPRTSEGGFWHKKIYPYQLWLDGVYMGMPFLAAWEGLFNDSEGIREAVHEFELVRKYCRDPKTGLYYHAWDEKAEQDWADPQTGLSKHFWGRGLGWYCMALVDMLDLIPERQAAERKILIDQIQELAIALRDVQCAETGTWWQIMDQPERAGNYREASASSMFTYFFAKAINEGYLDAQTWSDLTVKAYEGLIREFIEIDAQDHVHLTKVCRVAGLGYGRDGSYAYYMSEPVVKDDPKGVGPFIMAGVEVSKLLK